MMGGFELGGRCGAVVGAGLVTPVGFVELAGLDDKNAITRPTAKAMTKTMASESRTALRRPLCLADPSSFAGENI